MKSKDEFMRIWLAVRGKALSS